MESPVFRSVRFVALLSLAFAPALSAPLSAQQQLFSLDGNSRGGEFGSAVAMIGDVDADGVPDFAVGIPLDGTAGITAGRIRVFSGQTGALLYSVNGSNPGDEFGFSLVGIPDTNGDGTAEILVGAPYADPVGESSGQARMLSGATGATLLTLNGAAAGDRFGFSVGYAGTTGVFPFFTRRLLVGAPFVGFGPLTGLGDCYLFSESGTLIQEFKGFQTDMHSGWSVSGGFDMNGDGVPDIVVGAPDIDFNASEDGRVFVFSGASPYPAILGISGWTSSAARSGASVAMLADTNNDGRADILIGAPGDQSGKGSVRVYSGATGGILFSKNGVGAGDHFGTSVASAGDVNGDGRTDIVVGAPDATSGLGTATLCTGVNGVTLFTSTGVFAGGHLGSAVDGGQDLTGDGLLDLIMGSPDAAPIGAEQETFASSTARATR